MNAAVVLDHDTSATDRPTPPVSGLRLDPDHEAHEPPEARGVARDGVRLMVSRGVEAPEHAVFGDLARFVEPGDLLVVNTSGTVAAAVDGVTGAGAPVVVHVSNTLPGGLWLVEVRQPGDRGDGTSDPLVVVQPDTVHVDGGATFTLLAPFARSRRLWVATFEGP